MDAQHDPLLKDSLYVGQLANGLTVAVLPKPGFRQATARVAIRYGSMDSRFIDPASGQEVQVPDGIAHFLEHKLFEEEWGNVSDRFSQLGAEANAYTTYTHTVYYFSTTDNFASGFDLLLDFVQNPHFTDESVAKEQGIIEQEIRMYMDDPGWRSSANLMEALYAVHPVRIDIAGTVESIRQITRERLEQCHRVFYHPSNMVLFATGDLDPEQVMAAARHRFSQKEYTLQEQIRRILPAEPGRVHAPRRTERLVVNQPIFRMGFKDQQVGLRGRALLEQELLTALVLDAVAGRGSDLYTSLYESGLIDHRFGSEYSPEESYGFSYFAGPTRDPSELEVRLLAGLEEARQKGIPEADFERARRKLVGRLVGLMNDLDSIAYVFIDNFFKGIGLFDQIPVAGGLTLEAADARLRAHFDPRNAAVSVIYPR